MKKLIEIKEEDNAVIKLKKLAIDANLSFTEYLTDVLFNHSKNYK